MLASREAGGGTSGVRPLMERREQERGDKDGGEGPVKRNRFKSAKWEYKQSRCKSEFGLNRYWSQVVSLGG